ncbi:hypothetical protein EHS25_000925 [Saitozyma podzolica]|uniref:Uncharacterized protein n=1 Tax=Saitozyma podzolica TaxID=1890683 RepID=A0A427YXM7_9TREE|nr:hypothetical protein EHS25_000925 [Saitozyma podzolica]
MFKLLNELTKPPELLAPPSSHAEGPPPHFSYAPRHRGRSASPSLSQGSIGTETDQAAGEGGRGRGDGRGREAACGALEGSQEAAEEKKGFMLFVEILRLPGHARSRRAFRRHDGFAVLTRAMGGGLAHKPVEAGVSEEETQVEEAQRLEGVRLAFEDLAGLQLIGSHAHTSRCRADTSPF